MDEKKMNAKNTIANSFKWSAIGEVVIKINTPILNAILAHILLQEDYAPLAIITMLISFCEVFVESGFKKYLIQHKFESIEEEQKAFHVASWTTLAISLLIWGIIIAFCKPLSSFLGNGDIWLAVAISGCILPMYAMIGIFDSSIQKALEFKKIFWARVITSLIPLVITIPAAIAGLKYWALIIGNIASIMAQMLVLYFQSKYRIKLFYSFSLLFNMLSDTVWTLADGIAIWLTAWVDSLIITRFMSEYYLGLYKNSLATVTGLLNMIAAAVIPVLFVGLTKYQSDNKKFSNLFIQTQRMLAIILIPIGVGLFLFSDVAVMILFGNKWKEASQVVGITALTLALRTVYVSICSEAYRAKGLFNIPLLLQCADLCVLVPVCIISAKFGFWPLVYSRAFSRLVLIVPEFVLLKRVLDIDIRNQLKKQIPIILATVIMGIVGLEVRTFSDSIVWQIISIFICIVIYFSALLGLFSSVRSELTQTNFFQRIKRKIVK